MMHCQLAEGKAERMRKHSKHVFPLSYHNLSGGGQKKEQRFSHWKPKYENIFMQSKGDLMG